MRRKVFIIILILLTVGRALDYRGYKIYEIIPENSVQCETIRNLSRSNNDLDFLTQPSIPNHPARVLVAPEEQNDFENSLDGIDFTIVNHDVWEIFGALQTFTPRFGGKETGEVSFKKIMRYKEIDSYLDMLAKKYPNLVTVNTEGKSSQGRNLKTITITGPGGIGRKPVIFIDAGIHAREWIAPAAALYAIHQLVQRNEKYPHMLKYIAFVILPLVNPDGYEYSLIERKSWRKTMSVTNGTKCVGVDGNRNFDVLWGQVGTSDRPCDNMYQGPYPFSEPETQAVRSVMEKYTNRLKMYITLHSYGSFIFYPYGFTKNKTKTWKELDAVARAGADAMYAETNRRWAVGTASKLMYESSGGSDDYAYLKQHIPYAFTMELPPGKKGFHPAPSEIEPIASETWIGIQFMIIKMFEQLKAVNNIY